MHLKFRVGGTALILAASSLAACGNGAATEEAETPDEVAVEFHVSVREPVKTLGAEPRAVRLVLRLGGVEEFRLQMRPSMPKAKIGDARLAYLNGLFYVSLDSLGLEPTEQAQVFDFRVSEQYAAGRELFLSEITAGDKRILLIDGVPVDYCLARIPQGDEFRGNLAAGGKGRGQPLGERDRWIAAQVGPELRRRGMVFVGLDVIGDYLTEVNVTSPTCIRELDAQFGLNIAGTLFDRIEAGLAR